MADSPTQSSTATGPAPARRGALVDVLLLAALVLGIYFTRLDALPCSLDEPQWATIARNMAMTGDWVVPEMGSILCADRPPAHEWLMAASMRVLGHADMTSPRLPSAAATLLTVLLIYALGRAFLTRGGALAAGAAYATMWEVMSKGSTADSDSVYTLFVTASLFLWVLGYTRKWPPAATWCAGYFFAALACLTKGVQGPYFFAAAAGLFLFTRRDLRFLLRGGHLAGIAVFALTLGAWLIPFEMRTNSTAVRMIFAGNVEERFAHTGVLTVLRHLAIYPFDLFGMMMPWAPLLGLYALREFRQAVPRSSPAVAFLFAAMAAGIVPEWLAPGAHGRYAMPLFPCMAPFIGLALEKLMRSAAGSTIFRLNGVLRVMTGALVVAVGGIVLVASWAAPASYLAQPKAFAVCFFLVAAAVAWVLYRALRVPDGRCARMSVLALAAFTGLCFTGLRTNEYVRYKVDIQSAVAAAQQQLPAGAPLLCLGYLHPVFAYYFTGPLVVIPWPAHMADVPRGTDYFCFCGDRHPEANIPFAWTKISEVQCDRGTLTASNRSVIIGRVQGHASLEHTGQVTPAQP